MAIDLANKNIQMGGGPFGAVIVRQNEVVGAGSNQVTNHNDPTAHAEILAIREASQNLNDYNLSDCTLYTTCEPCPMCLGAIYWARIPHVFFGNNRQDAAGIGFDDDFIYKEIQLPLQKRSILMEPMLGEEAIATFKQWANLPHKTEY
ncbi:guanine deaminase [Geofilum rubicundum JCM 15548]|uniref:Guanine deaminase n=2 Tax=Geofilum TaxID=1236988 RepID=A0A0E9LVU6_9BACT|nr:guanine deaminase [Geofilum rubicundum JCM 15548]